MFPKVVILKQLKDISEFSRVQIMDSNIGQRASPFFIAIVSFLEFVFLWLQYLRKYPRFCRKEFWQAILELFHVIFVLTRLLTSY